MSPWHRARRVINFINLSTFLGLAIACLGRATVRPGELGLYYAHGYRIPFPVAGAFTVGNVVLTKHADGYLTGRLLDHESRHADQYAALIGLPMLVLYIVASGLSVTICGNPGSYNVFERMANLEDGGYARLRPWWRRSIPPEDECVIKDEPTRSGRPECRRPSRPAPPTRP